MNTLSIVKQLCTAGGAVILLLFSVQTLAENDINIDKPNLAVKTSGCILGGSGMVMHLDPQTGRPTSVPSAEQSNAWAALHSAKANRSTTGLVQQRGPTGGVSVNLRSRFRSPLVAVVNKNGSVSTEHLNCGRSAAVIRQGG